MSKAAETNALSATDTAQEKTVASGDVDEALKFLRDGGTATSTEINERALVRKIDWMMMPLMFCCYFLQYMDKTLSMACEGPSGLQLTDSSQLRIHHGSQRRHRLERERLLLCGFDILRILLLLRASAWLPYAEIPHGQVLGNQRYALLGVIPQPANRDSHTLGGMRRLSLRGQ